MSDSFLLGLNTTVGDALVRGIGRTGSVAIDQGPQSLLELTAWGKQLM